VILILSPVWAGPRYENPASDTNADFVCSRPVYVLGVADNSSDQEHITLFLAESTGEGVTWMVPLTLGITLVMVTAHFVYIVPWIPIVRNTIYHGIM
jgi:hypothetical protein